MGVWKLEGKRCADRWQKEELIQTKDEGWGAVRRALGLKKDSGEK